MREISRVVVPDACAWTLAWIGGDLFDVSDRFRRIPLDGSPCPEQADGYGTDYNSVVVSPKGDVFALVNTIGTEGLLVAADGSVIRELTRFDDEEGIPVAPGVRAFARRSCRDAGRRSFPLPASSSA